MILYILHHVDPHHELADILDPPTDDAAPLILLGVVILNTICGAITYFLMTEKDDLGCGCVGCGWLIFGMFLGPIALLVALTIPANRKDKDHEATQKDHEAH